MEFIKYNGNNKKYIKQRLRDISGDIYIDQGSRCNKALVIKYLNVSADLEVDSYIIIKNSEFAIVPESIGQEIEMTYLLYR